MHKLKGFKEFCKNSGLSYEEGIINLQKIVPPPLLHFSGEDIILDYNALGVCWQVFKDTLQSIGFPISKEALYSAGVSNDCSGSILSTAIHNSEVECRLISLYRSLQEEGKALSLRVVDELPIRTYCVIDSNGNVDTEYPIHKHLEQQIAVYD